MLLILPMSDAFQLDQVGFFAEFDCCGYRAVLVVGALCGVVTVGELDAI